MANLNCQSDPQKGLSPSHTHTHTIHNTYHNLIIIGNSCRSLADPLITQSEDTTTTNRKCMRTLLPWIHETMIQPSKNDLKEFPGNIQAAFNDTYFYYWDTANDFTVPPPRPYDQINDSIDDLELI